MLCSFYFLCWCVSYIFSSLGFCCIQLRFLPWSFVTLCSVHWYVFSGSFSFTQEACFYSDFNKLVVCGPSLCCFLPPLSTPTPAIILRALFSNQFIYPSSPTNSNGLISVYPSFHNFCSITGAWISWTQTNAARFMLCGARGTGQTFFCLGAGGLILHIRQRQMQMGPGCIHGWSGRECNRKSELERVNTLYMVS